MAGRTPRQAVRAFFAPIKTAVGCVSSQPLTLLVEPDFRIGARIGAMTQNLDAIPVRGTLGTFWISLAIAGQVVEDDRPDRGPFRVMTTQYSFTLSEDADEAREMLAYHWTPEAPGDQVRAPHLHVGRTVLNDRYRDDPMCLHRRHIRTDRVSVEQFALLLIEEFRVTPQNPRWHSVLASSHGTFARYRRPI
ncbi:MAG: hypothetical protein QM753_13470 [Thermomicrobiales bacterium]